jgi:CRISPR-associated protein Cas8a1/Csx13
MAKKLKSGGPDHLTMQLFGPGMSAIHRAGLGGLACTLKSLERQFQSGSVPKSRFPGPVEDGAPPWSIDEQTVKLRFGKPENAAEYLKRLFAYAFQIRKDGLIFLPGQFSDEPMAAVLADLQSGLTLTFLQHGKVRQLAKEPTVVAYDADGTGIPALAVNYRRCTRFKHQEGWAAFVEKDGCLVDRVMKVDGPISPGTVVRHVAYTGDTAAEDPPERMLPLYFALVGCLALPVNRGVAALIVPQVASLVDFQFDRPAMTPSTSRECQIANAADAGLRAQLRLRRNPTRQAQIASSARKQVGREVLPGCIAMTFTPTPWASQQKSRVATISIPTGDDKLLDRFDRAVSYLPPRIATRKVKEITGRGKLKTTVEHIDSFRTDSIVRPLIAENLALGKKWYAGFIKLMTKRNPATNVPFRKQLSFEQKGLHDMISDAQMWDHQGDALIVQAVHAAIRQSFRKIRKETDGKGAKTISQATKNRWKRFREKLRLGLVGAKTASQLRFVLADLFSRGGSNPILQESWSKVLPTIQTDWQRARDLGLLALASYAGKRKVA